MNAEFYEMNDADYEEQQAILAQDIEESEEVMSEVRREDKKEDWK